MGSPKLEIPPPSGSASKRKKVFWFFFSKKNSFPAYAACSARRCHQRSNGCNISPPPPLPVYAVETLAARMSCPQRIKVISDITLGPPSTALGFKSSRFNSARLHRLIASSRTIRAMTIGAMARIELALLAGHKQSHHIADVRKARRGRESLLSGNEAFTVYSVARSQSALDGDMAEVGVYQGCSAKIISIASGAKPLHLFDTFAGLPSPDEDEQDRMRTGHYAASLPSVQAFLADESNVNYYPGLFPQTASPVGDVRFSFVHLDVDLKSSTLDCLEFFYPRMVPGGVILTHDYSYLDGVREAFEAFLADKPEFTIELATSQAMLVKR
jgi:hypothetical protein